MSATRRQQHAADRAAEKAARAERKAATKGQVQTRAPAPTKEEPAERPYREPKPAGNPKRAPRSTSERDGQRLLSKIHGKDGREIIVMMRDSERTPEELAEYLMLNESIVITILGTLANHKERVRHLLAAIAEAPAYLEKDGRAPTSGVRKQKRQEKAEVARQQLADDRPRRDPKKDPKPPREFIVPTVDEVAPTLTDDQIVLEELKRYLDRNAELREQFMGVSSDLKAGRVLVLGVGRQFDTDVKAKLTKPSEYETLLVEAGTSIRQEVRKYDPPATSPANPAPGALELAKTVVTHQAQSDALARFIKMEEARKEAEARAENLDPETQARYARQREIMSGLPPKP